MKPALSLFIAALGWTLLASPPARAQARIQADPFVYKLVERRAGDIDKHLSGFLRLEPVACTFEDAVTKRISSFQGVGPCLYKSWRAGLKTKGDPGVIRVTFRSPKDPEREILAEAVWRSANESQTQALARFMKMRKDQGLPADMREQTFIGQLKLKFLTPIPPEWVVTGFRRVILFGQDGLLEGLEITSAHDETGRETLGQLLLFFEGQSEPGYEINYRTDRNILKPRAYFMEIEGR